MDIQPSDRRIQIQESIMMRSPKEPGPCGGFTPAYACMCDYHGVPFMDDVAWVRLPSCVLFPGRQWQVSIPTGKPEKWEGIFQSGKSQGILSVLKSENHDGHLGEIIVNVSVHKTLPNATFCTASWLHLIKESCCQFFMATSFYFT